MALHVFSTILSQTIPSNYYIPAALAVILVAAIRAYAQGRRTNRDRDLHARTVILTGAFTPLGLTLLEFLAKRGAHIIALVPTPSLTSHHGEILTLLRETTSNEAIYAEPCPLDSPAEIKKFCERFVNTENEKDRRVDALVMAHEYGHIGTWSAGIRSKVEMRKAESVKRDEGAMATFMLTTLLLPALLVAPVNRDIRVINIVNPFYAAAAPAFTPRLSSSTYSAAPATKSGSEPKPDATGNQDRIQLSTWSLEGQRALRSAVFTRHLQRILDALPESGSDPDSSSTNAPSGSDLNAQKKSKPQPSNILAVTVSPGISRTDTVAPYLLPSASAYSTSVARHWLGAFFYVLLLPLLHILSKTPNSALQSVLHVLCVPKPVTRRHDPLPEDPAQLPSQSQSQPPASSPAKQREEEEVLVPGALYTDCAVVKLDLRTVPGAGWDPAEGGGDDSGQFDPGLGDEPLGRAVWEALEDGIKIWERKEKNQATEMEEPSVSDRPATSVSQETQAEAKRK